MIKAEQMFSDYAKERGFGPRLFVLENVGFATYHLNQDHCYIEDIYVVPKERKNGHAKVMADAIAKIANENELSVLVGSVCIHAKTKEDSLKVLLAYGMKLAEINGDMIYLKKEI